jgi:hypothetical protein
MTAARSGPVFSVQDIPFSAYGSWFDISPVVAEKTYAEDLHLAWSPWTRRAESGP